MKLQVFLSFLAVAVCAAEPPIPQFRAVTIDDKIQIGYGLAIADVDGDKQPDILLADKKQIVWYRNPGPAKAAEPAAWSKFVIAENLTEKDNVCIAAEDLDGDGKCEVAVGAEWNPADTEKSGAVFYLIPPADRTQRWEPVKFPSVEPTTHRMRWIKFGEKEWGLVVVPLHGRGNKNGEGAPVKVLCYRKPADVRGEWKAEVVDESMHATHNFDLSPFGPGILLAGREGVRSIGWEAGRWTPQNAVRSEAAGEVRILKVQGKRGLVVTIEPMHGNVLAVFGTWFAGDDERRELAKILTDKLADGHALASGDILGTDIDQIVVGWRGKPGAPGSTTGVAVWTPLDAQGEKWRETIIDPDGMACEDLQLADLDGDGKLDIIAAGRATKNVKTYFNQTPR